MSIPSIIVLSDLTPSVEAENWGWRIKSDWNLAGDGWQTFNKLWYGNVDGQIGDSLDVSGIEGPKLPIIVLHSYVTMFDHLWALAFMQNDPGKGVIITGQPGIGVSESLLSLLCLHDSF